MPEVILPQFICPHFETEEYHYHLWFTGRGREANWVCEACAKAYPNPPESWLPANEANIKRIQEEFSWGGIRGRPEIPERDTSLQFVHLHWDPGKQVLDIQPDQTREDGWIALLASGRVAWLNVREQIIEKELRLPRLGFKITADSALQVSPRADYLAIYQMGGALGALICLADGSLTRRWTRGEHYPEVSCFPVAFWVHEGRTLLVMGTAWNRLDILDCKTNQIITAREFQPYKRGGPPPPHTLDYFHAGLCISPDGRIIADNGWVWHPYGEIRLWELEAWLRNPWESEDGPTVSGASIWRNYYWDGPLVWLDANTLAVWGYGEDDTWLLPALIFVDLRNVGDRNQRWFPGPEVRKCEVRPPRPRAQSLFFDTYLFAVSEEAGTTIWDHETGERLHADPSAKPWRQHPVSKEFLEVLPNGLRLSRLVT